jgi:hypothetical protein
MTVTASVQQTSQNNAEAMQICSSQQFPATAIKMLATVAADYTQQQKNIRFFIN